MRSLIFFLILITNTLFSGVAVLNGLAHEFNVSPGNIYRGSIELQNSSDGTQIVTLIQNDMSTKYNGETIYSDSLLHNLHVASKHV